MGCYRLHHRRWHTGRESNPRLRFWRPPSYRWTTGISGGVPHASRLCKAWPRATHPFERCTGVGPASAAWEAAVLAVVRTPRWHWAGRKEVKDPLVPRASDGIRTHSLPLRRRTHDPLCFQGFGAAFVHACGAGGVVLTWERRMVPRAAGVVLNDVVVVAVCRLGKCGRIRPGARFRHGCRVGCFVSFAGFAPASADVVVGGKVSGGTVFGKDEVGACGNVTRVFLRLPCECALAGLRPEVREAHRHRSRPGKGIEAPVGWR